MDKAVKNEAFSGLTDDANKILKAHTALEDKVPGQSFAGRSVNETILELIMAKEIKLAEKIKSDFKVGKKMLFIFFNRGLFIYIPNEA